MKWVLAVGNSSESERGPDGPEDVLQRYLASARHTSGPVPKWEYGRDGSTWLVVPDDCAWDVVLEDPLTFGWMNAEGRVLELPPLVVNGHAQGGPRYWWARWDDEYQLALT